MSDDGHPVVTHWPECSRCNVAYVLRRCLSMSQGWLWLWQPDCKHKSTAALRDAVIREVEPT